MAIRVAFIGAGSVGFTRRLIRDILSVPELQDTHVALHDISEHNLELVEQLIRKDIEGNDLPATLSTSLERREAVADAKYVVNCTRIGGLEAFEMDVEIPLKYGVDQCVGDTLAPGGIFYGQRNIPCVLDFCRDIREEAHPEALLLNYANPNAMNTWAACHYGDVWTVGLCHGVQGGHAQIASVIELLINEGRDQDDPKYRKVTRDDVDIICAGINHQTWYVQVLFEGEDWTDRLLEGFEKHPVYAKQEKVRIDVLRRFGYYSTESNGHLSEYLPWYRKRPKDIRRWIAMTGWIHGETGGYLRVTREGRDWFETDFPQWLESDDASVGCADRSHEHGSYIIEALETGRIYRGHFNVVNSDCITNLPPDAIVEVPGYVDRNGISIPQVGDLPLGCAAICNQSISVQRLAVEAAIEGDAELLTQAMLLDPLAGAVCDTEEISQMTDEMLVAQSQWLPQYAHELGDASDRLEAAREAGTYRGTRSTRGAARKNVRTVEQMRKGGKAQRRVATAADKGEVAANKKKTTTSRRGSGK